MRKTILILTVILTIMSQKVSAETLPHTDSENPYTFTLSEFIYWYDHSDEKQKLLVDQALFTAFREALAYNTMLESFHEKNKNFSPLFCGMTELPRLKQLRALLKAAANPRGDLRIAPSEPLEFALMEVLMKQYPCAIAP